MDLRTVDAALAQWRDRLVKLSRNVSELTELPDYVVLRNRVRGLTQPALRGRTAAEAVRLVASGEELARSVNLLGEAIDRADAARGRVNRLLFNQDECARGAMAILEGESIEVVLADVSVLDRDALGGAQDVARVSPSTLLAAIQGAYRSVSATLREVSGAELRVMGLLKQARADAAQFNDAGCAARLQELGILADTDPLGAAEIAERDILPGLAAAKAKAEAAQAALKSAEADITAARAELKELGALVKRAAAAADACREVIVNPAMPDAQIEQARELPGWLDRIAAKLAGGNITAARAGLTSWKVLLASVKGAQLSIETAAAEQTSRRDELRGRYGALKAKHQALNARGMVMVQADVASDQARAVLFGTATPLADAERLVAAYEAMLARAARN